MHRSLSSPFAPLPGTTARPRGLFIDRWGTLLQMPEAGRGKESPELSFVEGAVDALFRATRLGWRIYLIGNEELVGQGESGARHRDTIQTAMLETLAGAGVAVTRDYTCIQHPLGKARFQGDSVYLLPNTGAFYHAAHTDGIQLPKRWVIGDSTLELVAGWRSGCRQAGVRTGLALSDRTFGVDPEFMAETLAEAVMILLRGVSRAA